MSFPRAELEKLLPERRHPRPNSKPFVRGRWQVQTTACCYSWPNIRKWTRRAEVGESLSRYMQRVREMYLRPSRYRMRRHRWE